MPLITGLEIDNFRCFKKLRVEGLSRVNLFVGKNNSGKTALLEAVEAVVSVESPFILFRASMDRGESRTGRRSGMEDTIEIDVRRWFYGHQLNVGAAFTLRALGECEFYVSHSISRIGSDAVPPLIPGSFVLTVGPHPLRIYALMPDGFLRVAAFSPAYIDESVSDLRPPVGFITTSRLDAAALADLWKNVVLTPREEATVNALRLVEPAIDRIAISGRSDPTAAQVLLRGAPGPVPLGTLGEGVSRVLALALHLAKTQGGFLLIDEMENGLHWSVMPKIWRFLVETALRSTIQRTLARPRSKFGAYGATRARPAATVTSSAT